MNFPFRLSVAAWCLMMLLLAHHALAATTANDLELWYARPAAKWDEALPIGSGRMGAMVFGGTGEERIQFNEDTLWTGLPHDYVRAGARDHLEEIRQLVFAGRSKEAADLVRKSFLSDPVRQKAYQPFGDLRLTFAGYEGATDYRRSLDLRSAVASVSYKVGDVTYTREVLASYPDNLIAVRIAASVPGKVSFTVRMDSPHQDSRSTIEQGNTLKLDGQVHDPTQGDAPGMRFEARARVAATGGTVTASEGRVTVTGADEATVLLVAATNFVNFENVSGDPAGRCERYLAKLDGKSFAQLKARHVEDYGRLFNRVSLNLGRSDRASLPTDERIKLVRSAANPTASTAKSTPVPETLPPSGLASDPALASLFFQYGRYLLIASSRPHTQPANLQGVWNESLTPPWEGKYTTNINLEMNYWPAEVGNLGECAGPLFDMIDDLRVSGGRVAQAQYGARGWVLHHNTDHWRGAAPINNVDGVWPTGAAWLCYHLWEHYLFTGDRAFLASRAYPAMKEASLFFVDSLVKDPKTGALVTNPSISPEQGELCAGPAMDMQLVRALFDSTCEAAGVLGVDGDLVAKLGEVREKLAPDRIGQYGQLQEWQEDIDKPNNNHRHMSPLWGLYPGAQFTKAGDGKLFEAAKVLLDWRGDGSTGWSYAWRIPLHARAGNGEFAYRQLALQVGKRTLPNLFDLCGPFQIDGNFGATAGVAEMLLQSHVRPTENRELFEIDLLPALPGEWPAGSVSGLCARGGFEVGMEWAESRLTRVTLKSGLGRPCRVRYGAQVFDLTTRAGETVILGGDLRGVSERSGTSAESEQPIVIHGPEQSRVDPKLPDGSLPPVVGVQSFQVFRASASAPELADGKGWTYHHHVDMARWKGRLYVGWDSCQRDEDVWPSRELYSTSTDGATWSAPAELFPQGVSTALRMYFYLADNGRMLAVAGLRTGTAELSEDKKGGMVVREIRADHTLGDVYTLQGVGGDPQPPTAPPLFERSADAGFVVACRQVLGDRTFLEQQDLGRLLGERRMKWHEASAWPRGSVPGDSDKWVFGKALAFFGRADGTLVGISKMGWVTTSVDSGATWSRPVVPPTLVTGKAKVWPQRTGDGRYALVYNPSREVRYPLVAVVGEDGKEFSGMRVVQGEMPVQRYAGLHRSVGPQYVRGISRWSDDGSEAGGGKETMWVAYSMSKEDIWVSRVPLPYRADQAEDVGDDLASAPVGAIVRGWNTYCPKWAEVSVVDMADGGGRALKLRDADPYDYARAVRVFRVGICKTIEFDVRAGQVDRGRLEIELESAWGAKRPVRITLGEDGNVRAADGARLVSLGAYKAGDWLAFRVDVDLGRGRYSVLLNGRSVLTDAAIAEAAEDVQRVSFRTGEYRGIGGSHPVTAGSDRPAAAAAEFVVRHVTTAELKERSR